MGQDDSATKLRAEDRSHCRVGRTCGRIADHTLAGRCSAKRFLYVAIDRCSRSIHLAVKDDETEQSAITLLCETAAAFPFHLIHVLTDNGLCFTPAFAERLKARRTLAKGKPQGRASPTIQPKHA